MEHSDPMVVQSTAHVYGWDRVRMRCALQQDLAMKGMQMYGLAAVAAFVITLALTGCNQQPITQSGPGLDACNAAGDVEFKCVACGQRFKTCASCGNVALGHEEFNHVPLHAKPCGGHGQIVPVE